MRRRSPGTALVFFFFYASERVWDVGYINLPIRDDLVYSVFWKLRQSQFLHALTAHFPPVSGWR